jgi:endonuclease-3
MTAPRDRRGRAAAILEILDRLYPDVDSFLDHADPYQLLVATILSAQCTDARVNLVTPALFARAPDAATMTTLTPRELRKYIKSCGLAPMKARNIVAMSRALLKHHAGQVPNDLEALERLPGVGHKTASVVLSQAYGAAVFPVDTHIHRLAGRWQLSRARNVDEVERDLKAVFPVERWNTLHLQLIEFGRAHCTAKQHDLAACPICSWAMSKARARAELRQGLSKPKRPKKTTAPAPKPKTELSPRMQRSRKARRGSGRTPTRRKRR